MGKLLFILVLFYSLIINAQSREKYTKYIDSLYQINLKINNILIEPAIWFTDSRGALYDYPPINEQIQINKEDSSYYIQRDSLDLIAERNMVEWKNKKQQK
jgi:hypothetical protein